MRRLRREMVQAGLRPLVAWIGPAGLAIALAGCAAASAERAAQFQPVEPTTRVGLQADDPSEPFNRNYGMQPSVRRAGQSARMSPAEEDAVIAQAIVAHEMRRP